MRQVTVGIIGINGKYGKWLHNLFKELGHNVIGSDLETELTNERVVKTADVVMFSVPINKTVDIIQRLTSFSRPNQLWLDITSIKAEPVKVMLASRAEVVGLHPMCAPTVKTWKGQTVVVCRGRCDDQWFSWLCGVLEQSQATIKLIDPDTHDQIMAVVQGLTHANSLIMAAVMQALNVNASQTLEFASPVYTLSLMQMGRILAQSPSLYADIQMTNPHVLTVLKTMEQQLHRFYEIVSARNREEFEKMFKSLRSHLGPENVQNSFDLCQQTIDFMANLSEKSTR